VIVYTQGIFAYILIRTVFYFIHKPIFLFIIWLLAMVCSNRKGQV